MDYQKVFCKRKLNGIIQGKVDELKEKGAELEKLKTEFDNYKVRNTDGVVLSLFYKK